MLFKISFVITMIFILQLVLYFRGKKFEECALDGTAIFVVFCALLGFLKVIKIGMGL